MDLRVSLLRKDFALDVRLKKLQKHHLLGVAEDLAADIGQHFIERFRSVLIQRTREVNSVLDDLRTDILSQEQYDAIRSKGTKQEQMRELYDLLPGWDQERKDRVYKTLKKHNESLIHELHGK
ncbi:apoptosis-associated speck-like protein containing a CARD isoform A [Alligator mississippiensis]|uniref:Apoptosis-associated speck-like protein containing a CARD isoform A n=1 Tax=Alligator mississippiensis TaxID=8496 RepID=A0A151P0V6_ALLMI|nr:apoptosis-associated speck-like protein containing a CARD isoform A [Alligator mississippiensis]